MKLVAAVITVSAACLPAAIGYASTPSTSNLPARAKHVEFGAKLTSHSQPSNSFSPTSCRDDTGTAGACTRVLTEALGRPGTGQLAPRNGTIKEIKLVAGDSGHFRLEIARAEPAKKRARIVERGPVIHYTGQGGIDDGGPYTIETFHVDIKVKKGEYLAIQSKATSMLQCSGGGLNQLLFQPALQEGAGYSTTTHVDGCLLLLEAVY
jgi:hypothetical protein